MATSDLVAKIGAENKLEDRATSLVSEVVAWTLMGFLHLSGVAGTIQEYAGVSLEVAKALAQDLNEKIFKDYAAELEKVYTPMGITPSKIIDISSPAPSKAPIAPKPAPVPLTSMPMPAAPMPASKKEFDYASALKMPMPAAKPGESPKPWQPTKLGVPTVVPTAPSAPGASAAPAPAETPAPFMMHEESTAAPLATGADFKLNISKDMFKSAPTRPMDVPRPPKAAELEIGKAPLPPKPPGVVSFRTTPDEQSRVVHYTDLRTTITAGFGVAPPPAMSVSNPPAAPQAPSMPQPPPPMQSPAPMRPVAPPAAPMPAAAAPSTPTPPKPPKVVNFGPEEVK